MSILDNVQGLVASVAGPLLFEDAALVSRGTATPDGRGGFLYADVVTEIRALVSESDQGHEGADPTTSPDRAAIMVLLDGLQLEVLTGAYIALNGVAYNAVSVEVDAADAVATCACDRAGVAVGSGVNIEIILGGGGSGGDGTLFVSQGLQAVASSVSFILPNSIVMGLTLDDIGSTADIQTLVPRSFAIAGSLELVQSSASLEVLDPINVGVDVTLGGVTTNIAATASALASVSQQLGQIVFDVDVDVGAAFAVSSNLNPIAQGTIPVAVGVAASVSASLGAIDSSANLTVTDPVDGNEPETDALIAQMAVAPTAARETAINDCIAAIKASGAWGKLGWLSIVGQDEDASLKNWINPTESLTALAGSPIVADQYFDAQGTTGNGGFRAGLAGDGGAALADMTFGAYFLKLDETGSSRASRVTDNQTFFRCDFSSPQLKITGGSTLRNNYADRDVNGLYHMTAVHRGTGAADREGYYNGVSYDTKDGAGGSLSLTANVDLMGTSAKDADCHYFCGYYGKALTAAEVLAVYNAVEAYKAAL